MRVLRLTVRIVLIGAFVIFLAACSGDTGPGGPAGATGPAGPQGPAGNAGPAGAAGNDALLDIMDLSCTECHDDTTLIVSKAAQLEERSVHGTGEAFERGSSTSCAGCHGHEGASTRIAAGLPPHDVSVEGVTNVSPYNCRTCHDVHMTYTGADWALTGGAQAVTLEMTGGTFDKGAGNLCANCHQIRNELPVAADGLIEVTSTRFGTHHGVEAAMLLGEGGYGVTGEASPHYNATEDGCVTCHMGESQSHEFEPALANCQSCHDGLDTFDRNGVQTDIETLLEEVKALLIQAGIMDADYLDDGGSLQQNRSVAGTYPEAVAGAMWNYMFVLEDQSHGVHNSAFTEAMLEAAKAALGG